MACRDCRNRRCFTGSSSALLKFSESLPSPLSLGVYVDLRRAIGAVVHCDGTAFPRILAATFPDRMARTFALFFQCPRKRQRSSAPSISLDAPGLVVPVVARCCPGSGLWLAKSHSAARVGLF